MKRISWMGALLCLFWLFPPVPLFAARPLFTEDAGTLEKGALGLELAFDYYRHESQDEDYIPSAQLKYGLLNGMEIGASIGYIHRDLHSEDRIDGWSDLIVHLKYQILPEGDYYPAFTLKPQVKFPTASWKKGVGSGKTDYALGAVFSKSLNRFNLHFDAIYFFIGDEGKTDILSTGPALEYEFAKGWTAVGEVRYLNNFNTNRKDDPLFLNFGLKKEVGWAVLDAAMNVGLNSAAPEYGFTVGVTIPFK